MALLFMAMSSGRAAGQELLSLSLSPLPSALCVLSMAIRIRGLLHLTCGCDAGPEKVFTLISSYFFSHFIFRFLGFPFPFFFFIAFSLLSNWQLPNRKRGLRGGMRGSRSEPNATPKTNLNFRKSSCKFTRRGERERQREARVANIGFGLKQPDQRNL